MRGSTFLQKRRPLNLQEHEEHEEHEEQQRNRQKRVTIFGEEVIRLTDNLKATLARGSEESSADLQDRSLNRRR